MKPLSKQKFIRTLKDTNNLWWYNNKIHKEIITIHNFESFEDLFENITVVNEVNYVDNYKANFKKSYQRINRLFYKHDK